uniref:Neurexin-4 n=1 Tax=Macrostomum lignano TaxID=282301 RepID=A0A1I8IX53_9PLAT
FAKWPSVSSFETQTHSAACGSGIDRCSRAANGAPWFLDTDLWLAAAAQLMALKFQLTVGNSDLDSEFRTGTKVLVVTHIFVGVLANPKDYKLLETSDISLGHLDGAGPRSDPDASGPPYFVGSLAQFSFNNVRYFERDAKLDAATTLEVTARVDDSPVAVVLPFTVRSSAAFAELPPLRLYELFRIRLSLRTSQSSGLLLLNSGRGGGQVADFFLLELLDGRIRLALNAGSGLAELKLGELLNDNRWHEVEVLRPALDRIALRVDGRHKETAMPAAFDGASEASRRAGLNVDVGDRPVYLGGAPQDELLGLKSGGCLGSVHLYEDINSPQQQPYDVIALRRNRTSFESDITDSCQKPRVQCGPRTCHYGGQCVQQWDSVACNCDTTSFTGAWCSRVGSATFQFGASGRVGRISFEFVDDSFLPTTKRDEVSFGFQTSKSSCVLVLIEARRSAGLIPDFIAIQVLKGRLTVNYYLKSSINSLVKTHLNVSDGRYHRVRFLREEARGSLFVDDSKPVVANPGAGFGTTFNSQKAIYVGSMASMAQPDVADKAVTMLSVSGADGPRPRSRRGRRSAVRTEWSHFEGYLTGLVFNGVALSRIAADDPVASSVAKLRTERFGDVSQVEDFQPRLDGFPPPDPPDSYLHPELMMSTSPVEATTTSAIIESKIRCAPASSAIKSAADCIGSGGIIAPEMEPLGSGESSRGATDAPSGSDRDGWPGWRSPTQTPRDSTETRETKTTGGKQSSAKIDIFIIVIVAASGAVLLFVFFCLIYRCRSKNEGSYRVDETQNFEDPALKPLRGAAHANGDVRTKMATKKRDIKEWYPSRTHPADPAQCPRQNSDIKKWRKPRSGLERQSSSRTPRAGPFSIWSSSSFLVSSSHFRICSMVRPYHWSMLQNTCLWKFVKIRRSICGGSPVRYDDSDWKQKQHWEGPATPVAAHSSSSQLTVWMKLSMRALQAEPLELAGDQLVGAHQPGRRSSPTRAGW